MNRIEKLSKSLIPKVQNFLSQYEESSQFLMNNLKIYGESLSEHPNSGNYKIILDDEKITGVFCLTKRGNLISQIPMEFNPLDIISECKKEEIPLKGFIGPWDSVEKIYNCFCDMNPNYNPNFYSKEILYRYELNDDDFKLVSNDHVRHLIPDDFDRWLVLNIAYCEELGLPYSKELERRRIDFSQMTKEKLWWGLFNNGKLVSIAGLNSKGEKVAQVGGVYTCLEERKKGYSKKTMFHLLKDCRDDFKHYKSILFTGENDFPAQKLYESIGYEKIGSFALILS